MTGPPEHKPPHGRGAAAEAVAQQESVSTSEDRSTAPPRLAALSPSVPDVGGTIAEHMLAWAKAGEVMPRRRVDRGRKLIDALAGTPRVGLRGPDQVVGYLADRGEPQAFALVCGPASDLLAVDLDRHGDGPDGLATWAELEAEHGAVCVPFSLTPNGGRHLLFRWPEGCRATGARTIAPGVEAVARWGAISAPPSAKAGRPYRWSLSRHPAWLARPEAPPWLVPMAEPPRPEPRPRPMRPDRPGTRYVEAAIQREAETVTTAPAGNRNHQLNRSTWALARFVGEGLTTPASIEHAMMEAAAEAGIAAREAATTIRSALRRASR